MKSIMTFAAVAICGLSVFVAGCSDEAKPADNAPAAQKAAEKGVADAAKAVTDAAKAVEKKAEEAKKAAEGAKK